MDKVEYLFKESLMAIINADAETAMEADMGKFDNVGPWHVHPWRDPRGGVSQETAMEADMKELKIGGVLESVSYDFPTNEIVITIRTPAEKAAMEAVGVARNGQKVQLHLNPWVKKIQDAGNIIRKGKPKVQFNSLTPEGTDLEKLKGEVEAMGLVALKPHSEGQRGLAARVAMRTYSRLVREEDPEEADVYWELANYFDKKMEGGTGS